MKEEDEYYGCVTSWGKSVKLCIQENWDAYIPQHLPRTKHIERRHFFIREKVEDFTLVVPFVRTADNLAADFFTKPLGFKTFFPMRDAATLS